MCSTTQLPLQISLIGKWNKKQLFAIKFPTFALIMHEIAFKLMSNVFVVNFSLGELQIIICLNDSKSG